MTSDTENQFPDEPIIGIVGIILSTAYRAVNIDIIAMSLVFGTFFVMLTMFGHLLVIFVSRCSFLHSV